MKKRITIHDIAKQAEVSSATVSRVLSDSDYPVSDKLKHKIRRLAKEMNYIPNMIGKQLKTHNNMTIGVIIPSITNPFYSSVMLGIEEVARKSGYHVLLCNSLQNAAVEDEYLMTLAGKQVKGIIISSLSSNGGLLSHLMDMGMNVVAIDQKIDAPAVQQIEFDYRKGGYLATKHLISQGHRRIGYVTAPLDRPSRVFIYEGYKEALRDHEIGMDETLVQIARNETDVYNGQYEFDNGRRLAQQLLELQDPPTAIFACNDLTAFGVMNGLSTHGLQIPGDISVIGFDDIEFSGMMTPSLTTVRQPGFDMGKLACSLLLEKLEGERSEAADVMLQPILIERGSVRALEVD